MDETQLINGCRKGDRLAQKELYERQNDGSLSALCERQGDCS